MASQQHLYRRGAVYWWRRVLDLSTQARCDIRLSLRTTVKAEARQRAGYLTAMAGSNAMTANNHARVTPSACDRRMTASQLTAIYKDGLDSALATFIYQQDMLPGQATLNRQFNEASGDYYQWLIDTGGQATVIDDAYLANLEASGIDRDRIDRLGLTIASRVGEQSAINASTIKQAVANADLPLNKTNYGIARRQLWVAYRDAARAAESERQSRAGPVAEASAAPAAVLVPAPTPTSTPTIEPDKPAGVTIEAAMEACIKAARPKDGSLWPSEVQVCTAIRLLVHVTGEGFAIDSLLQRHIGEVADLMKQLPNRWGRTRKELDGGIAASLERAATLPTAQTGISNATQQKHFTWIRKVVDHASRHGYGPVIALRYNDFRKDNREPTVRARNLRPKWTKPEITRLLEAPIFNGCAGLQDVQRMKPGSDVYHDGWYFVSLLFIHLGGRSAEFVGMPMEHVYEDRIIPSVEIDFHVSRRIKNVQSERLLPIHPELIRLGFLDYIKNARADNQIMLFPEFDSPNSKSFASTYYKKVFTNWRSWAFPNGTPERKMIRGAWKDKDVYSFRGRAASEMQGKVPDSVISDILGHEQATTAGRSYAVGSTVAVMLAAMSHTTHLTSHMQAHLLNMRPSALRKFGATAGIGGRPTKVVADSI